MTRPPEKLADHVRYEDGTGRLHWPPLERLLADEPEARRAAEVIARIRAAGHQALLVGGCVRDSLLGLAPREYDIATSARPDEIEALFPKTFAVGRAFGVIKVVHAKFVFEVATFRSDLSYTDGRHPDAVRFSDRRGDAERRDFTLNALYYDAESCEVIDDVGGLADLDAGTLRAIGDPAVRFAEDYLRMMRAVRFAARYDLRIDPPTAEAVRRLADRITLVSAERIQDELRKILTDRAPALGLRLLDDLRLLGVLFPETADMKLCEQPKNYHPEGDVFVHSILTVEKLGPHPPFELALAALLHDVGKPEASRRTEKFKFAGHERIGEDQAGAVCRRLRMSNDETERVTWLVRRHMYFKDAKRMKQSKLKRLIAHPDFDMLAELHRADAMASWGVLDDYDFVMDFRRGLKKEDVRPPRLVTGRDLLERGYQAGPAFKTILDAVEDAQLDGTITTREEALQLADRLAGELGLVASDG